MVTSKEDSGIGTLRQAIHDANINGTSTTDYIYFNLPGLSSSDVTISLTQELPSLSSNLVIDATTQPTNLLGSSSIKVLLTRISVDYINGLKVSGVNNIKIFGFYFSNFVSPLGIPADDRTAAIFLENCSKITIGGPRKRNGFGNNYTSIISPTFLNSIEDIKISSNIIGLDPTGMIATPNYVGIDLSYLSNSIIGGIQEEEGNIISSNENGVSLGSMRNRVRFSNNTIGYNIIKSEVIPSPADAVGLFANGEFVDFIMTHNYIVAQNVGVKLDNLKNNYYLNANVIGGDLLSKNRKYGIELYNCGVGSISDGNVISHNEVGIFIERSYPVSILKNSFYCNTRPIEFVNLPNGKFVAISAISNITSTSINGTYLPNSKIELFYTDACVNCEGKEWIATILTDGLGNWSYNGAIDLTRSITSMGTNQDGATAPFSKPLMDQANAIKTDVICNQPKGSIRGIMTYDASIFEWRDANGLIVGTAKDLEGVGPGTYRLTAKQNNSCYATSNAFTITSSGTGILENNKEIVKAYCNQSNGAITRIVTPNNVPRIWYNEAGVEVGRGDDLTNVPAGTYYFTAQLGTCNISSPNYVVANFEFDYKVAAENVKDATCSQDNGSISINAFQGARPDYVKWFNESNVEVGNSETISGLAAGRYRLMGYSNFGCSYLIKEYAIAEIRSPMVNLQNLKQYINCDGKLVSTSGIQVDGQSAPYSFAWVDQNQNIVATTLNLKNIQIGKYLLKVTDRYGCIVQSNIIDFTQLEETIVKIPNTFTPNGDSINDVWEIKGIENYPEAEFNIFNRSGATIFTSRGYSRPFDGTFNGKELPVGVYYYKINLNTECGVLTGSLTIIR
ncbi:gliding motility-associated C-terminal domain-containing protein [Pedobacter sp. SL55]|uniref:T9SS type B sorting domain-containing protein n=1 Tax=Pedobacter sp. SL55 TaxID=2995161 RepID=UPI00226E46CD|nr:gliding motility-associated C-terminal domain-containing protein [Pedobacter sp. SL55]WAC41931.1 gliding motility-associated C-terminal domain-containing protein [Pedobacter sp. SL55]